MSYNPGEVPGCDRCGSPAPDLGLVLGDVDGEEVCHACRREELVEETFLSEQEALTATLKQFGKSHEEIAEWGDIEKSTVDEYSRRINAKREKAHRTVELLSDDA